MKRGFLAAMERGRAVGFDVKVEEVRRMAMATARWYEKMKRKRLKTNRNILPANIKKNTSQGPSFTQEQYDFEDCILPVNDKTFWRILKDEGIKYSTHSKPYICPVCAEGPVKRRFAREH